MTSSGRRVGQKPAVVTSAQAPHTTATESREVTESTAATAADVVTALIDRGLTLAVAESLTGGMLISELVGIPGASATVLGGVVAYNTRVKHTVLGVDDSLLLERGPVDPVVAEQMADRVRAVLAVDGRPADIGVATTGVAGPDPQAGRAVGTVYMGFAIADRVFARGLQLRGDRADIRSATVSAAVAELWRLINSGNA